MSDIIWFSIILCLVYYQRNLHLENIFLRHQLQLYHSKLSKGERRAIIKEWFRRLCVWLVRISKLLGLKWADYILIVSPRSVLLWYEKRYADWWTLKIRNGKRKPGKPPLSKEQIDLLRQLARENPLWYPVIIAGKFFEITGRWIHRDTVRKYLIPREPDPLRVLRWNNFLKLHMPDIAAMDFFILNRWGFSPLMGFFIIKHERRELLHINITDHPTSDWVKEQLLCAFGVNGNLKYLISDNDVLFKNIADYTSSILGIRQIHTQIASPWQNGVAERFVRTLRYDLLNYMVPLSQSVVRMRLQEYKHYYNYSNTQSP